MSVRARRPSLIAVGLAVLVLAAVALSLVRHAPRLALPAGAAVHDAVADPATGKVLRAIGYDHVNVSAVDGHVDRISFFAGARIVAAVVVSRDGAVQQDFDYTRSRVPYGNWLAYTPAILVGLAALFVLMAAVVPLRRLRNLDVAAALTLVAPVVLIQQRYVGASVICALPGLAYLLVRSAALALAGDRPPGPSTPLFERLTPALGAHERVRVLRLLLGGTALTFVIVAFTSPDPVDVILGVMEGATKLVHGVLPYGHMPGDVVHGDTYPLLSYVAYTPVALMSPVHTVWSDVDGVLAITAIVALVGAGALFVATAGRRPGRRMPRDPDAETAGLRAALIWLSFPPLLITVSTGTTDVVLAVMLLVTVLLYRRPVASCTLLAAAGWFKLAPFALIPVWFAPLRGRRRLGAVAGLAAVSAAMLIVLLALGGPGGPAAMVHAVSYQFSRGSPQSLWVALGATWLQPIAQAAALALIAVLALHLRRRPELALQRERMAAAAVAVLIAVQLVADYWAFLYLVWVVPLLALNAFAQPVAETAADPVKASRSPVGAFVPAPARE